ncbi:MAG: hypothetical protein M1308_01240 [Actinobacteria bacterium]|nr:hypothetical protein [Actinomycetota bacterium]
MENMIIKELGEYVPGKFNSVTLNKLKEFIVVPYFIDWYKSSQSRKIFPLFLQELSDLNPTSFRFPGILTHNPFFDHAQIKYFIAHTSDKKPLGRIMAFIDYNYNKQHKETTGGFGLFESTQDKNTALKLIDAAIDYLKKNSCNKVIGPAKFSAAGEIGCLIEGFENKPYFMEPYNAPYYSDFFEEYGFKKENDWYAMNTDAIIANGYMEKIEKIMGRINGTRRDSSAAGFVIRNADFGKMKSEIKIIRDLYNDIWNTEHHPQQVVITDKEFDILAAGIKSIAIEDLIFIVEKDNVPIGVSVSVPDINEIIEQYDRKNPAVPSKKFFSIRDLKRDLGIFNIIKTRLKEKNFAGLRIMILGVREEYRKAGIDSKLYYKTFKTAKDLGFTHGSGSQLADINLDIINPLFKMGKKSMTWRVYSLDI